ncbi:hypothetical protein QBC46DRAFT_424220 [Diplogelasinospora grovesii]|uniref:C2H2-type domain-containing protein n=1 Tax=Diplogelasinospora grovesii TaxID=303347 RepID=A0AAN6S0A6_9PEZI|nr:hypothetical protein QBC46DRAFT_424220 [Diplogelasinospora grovesii]
MMGEEPCPGACAEYANRVLDRAINSGRLSDRSALDPHAVRRNLRKGSKSNYFRVMDIWDAYESRKIGGDDGDDPRNMQTMKHFAEVLGLGLMARLDTEKGVVTTTTVRNKMRQFYNQWERSRHKIISDEVKLSMAPYIEGELADKIGLSRLRKDKGFFTRPLYVRMYELMWTRDSHEYVHEGSRVDASTLLNTHCYTAARLREVCGAKYEDIICMVGWKDNELDIKMGFKREICKGLDYNHGAPRGQVKKFAAHRNDQVLASHYLHNLTTVDGTACYLGLQPRKDLTGDFRTATKRIQNSGSLPSVWRKNLYQRDDYAAISKEIECLSLQIKRAGNEEEQDKYQAKRTAAYKKRAQLENEELKKYQGSARQELQGEQHQGGWRKTHFDRIRHMMPERNRLAHTLFLGVPLRSPEGTSAIRDLIALRTNDCRAAYQEVLRPINGCCPTASCGQEMKRIPIGTRWDHVFRCQERALKKQHGFAKFCYLPICSKWITSETEWHAHCQSHIDKEETPSRCNPVKFRHAVACAGYCPFDLGNKKAPAIERMQSFMDRSAWQRHIFLCGARYMTREKNECPLSCPGRFESESDLWHHLEDVHSTPEPQVGTKRKSSPDENREEKLQPPRTIKRRWGPNLPDEPKKSAGAKFINTSALDPRPKDPEVVIPEVATNSSGRNTPLSSLFDTDRTFSSQTPSTMSVTSPSINDVFAFGASREQTLHSTVPTEGTFTVDGLQDPSPEEWADSSLPIPPGRFNFSMDMLDPVLRIDTAAPEPMEDVRAKPLQHHDRTSHAVAQSAAGDPGDTVTDPLISSPETTDQPSPTQQMEYLVDCLLDKWGGWFFVKWLDGSRTWEPEENILDDMLIDDFAKRHRGLGCGVEVVRTRRTEGGKAEYRVHFIGRPKEEDEWVAEKHVSRELVEKHKPSKKTKRGRRRG